MLRYFLLSFLAGVAFSLFYIFFGSWTWFTPNPRWAQILFAPGLVTGAWAHEFVFGHIQNQNADLLGSEAVGVATMGLVFGGMGCLMRFGIGKEQ